MTIYLYPNIFLNSNVLSSFEIDEKSIKEPDYFNTTRYVNGPLEKDSEEWSDPANQWKDFIDFEVAENEDLMDALYYADEKQGKWALKEQARYFTDLLLWDERNYFAYRLGNLEIDF